MKKALLIPLFIILMFQSVNAELVYGARSLALGGGGRAWAVDVNSMFLNPALLGSYRREGFSYNFQYNYSDYREFNDLMKDVTGTFSKGLDGLSPDQWGSFLDNLQKIHDSVYGMNGYRTKAPSYVGGGYGFSVSFVKQGFVNPASTDIFSKPKDQITQDDVNSLKMNFTGLSYKKYTMAYGMGLSKTLSMGICVNYLSGKADGFDRNLALFNSDKTVKDYVDFSWDNADTKISKFTFDLAFSLDLGQFVKVAAVVRNVGSPELKFNGRKYVFDRKVTIAAAFRPSADWAFLVDVDLYEIKYSNSGGKVRPFSIGIEKSFFQNRFFVRGGLKSDFSEDNFLSGKSDLLYSIGIGFNFNKLVLDAGVAIDGSGRMNALAISGFFAIR